MQAKTNYSIALVTAPELITARELAKSALVARLAACANLIPKIESHYWWEGKLESSAEVLIVFKTTRAKLKALEKLILETHPYDTPEFTSRSEGEPCRSGRGTPEDSNTNHQAPEKLPISSSKRFAVKNRGRGRLSLCDLEF